VIKGFYTIDHITTVRCKAGQTSNVEGDNVNDCTECPAGMISVLSQTGQATGSWTCIATTAGYYTTDNINQWQCPAGTWAAATVNGGTTTCTSSAAGKYIAAAGASTNSVNCAAGYNSFVGATVCWRVEPTGQPSSMPSASPTYKAETWGEVTWDRKRHRQGGLCENHCSGHGTCEKNNNCKCYNGLDGEAFYTGPDCSQRTCPKDFSWVGSVVNANDLHPWAECSNKGTCDRKTGTCQCFPGYDGWACARTVCPNDCNNRGTCWPEKYLAAKVGRLYTQPWDAMKEAGCLCDAGYRGPDCSLQECPSGQDPLDGYGNESGRDCSGRGICDYSAGLCTFFSGFFGTRCQHQTTLY